MSLKLISFICIFIIVGGMQIVSHHGKHNSKHGMIGYRQDIKYFNTLPEVDMNSSEIIKYWGYPCENHDIVTEDGYILTVQRIPHGRGGKQKNKIPVFLQHGLIDSSATWINNPPEESLGFILADNGYDVWIGNSRGNTYSRRHVNISTESDQFWDFSFDEMAKYDIPACIDYVLSKTGQEQLHYIGHSQGTMVGFIAFSSSQELGKKVKTFSALAPVATVGHIKGAMRVLSYFTSEIEFLFKLFGIREFLPSNIITKALAEIVCESHITEAVCADFIFLLCGFDTSNLNDTRIPVYVSHTPAGTSVKDIVHFAQLIKNKKFQMYDYGEKGNMEKYHAAVPPQYNVTKMETPVALFTATNDWLADPYDVNHSLRPYLSNIIQDKNIDEWNHLDFVWGEDAHSIIYEDILKILAEYDD